jgi:glucose-fructose oxidoreductase
MAPTSAECEEMTRACEDHGVALMIAYRLHFEQSNLAAIEAVTSGRIGDPRYFASEFSYQVKPGNVRLEPVPGAGPVWDIGVYCVNAARYLFRAEPSEVFAYRVGGRDERSRAVEEGAAALLRFPGDRLAQFTVSYNAAGVDSYRIVGAEGDLYLDHAYDYAEEPMLCLNSRGKLKEKTFKRHDQFGAEIAYFSRCVIDGVQPEPSGREGLADVRVIEALFRSTEENRPVGVLAVDPGLRPDPGQEIDLRKRRQPRMVNADEASEED